MVATQRIAAEVDQWRAVVRQNGHLTRHILLTRPRRVVVNILCDWGVIALAVAAAHLVAVLLPLALLLIGNRQRALGNILHDAGHRNVSRHPALNDLIANVLIAPALFTDLHTYRATHARHHAVLGHSRNDPDFIRPTESGNRAWSRVYWTLLTDRKTWLRSTFGCLHGGACRAGWIKMAAWWGVMLTLLGTQAGWHCSASFLALWVVARATVFHAITTFREMCDHFGMTPGGVLTFTRDIHTHSAIRWLIHPHNNGYHLTHHLLPSVPYHYLPTAHALLGRLRPYAEQGTVCNSYFLGDKAVIRSNTYWASL